MPNLHLYFLGAHVCLFVLDASAHIGSTMPGMVVAVAVKAGDKVKKGQKLLTLEAMKMETMINAEQDGEVQEVLVTSGSQVETGDLLMVIE